MGYVALDKDEVKVIKAAQRIREAGGPEYVPQKSYRASGKPARASVSYRMLRHATLRGEI